MKQAWFADDATAVCTLIYLMVEPHGGTTRLKDQTMGTTQMPLTHG